MDNGQRLRSSSVQLPIVSSTTIFDLNSPRIQSTFNYIESNPDLNPESSNISKLYVLPVTIYPLSVPSPHSTLGLDTHRSPQSKRRQITIQHNITSHGVRYTPWFAPPATTQLFSQNNPHPLGTCHFTVNLSVCSNSTILVHYTEYDASGQSRSMMRCIRWFSGHEKRITTIAAYQPSCNNTTQDAFQRKFQCYTSAMHNLRASGQYLVALLGNASPPHEEHDQPGVLTAELDPSLPRAPPSSIAPPGVTNLRAILDYLSLSSDNHHMLDPLLPTMEAQAAHPLTYHLHQVSDQHQGYTSVVDNTTTSPTGLYQDGMQHPAPSNNPQAIAAKHHQYHLQNSIHHGYYYTVGCEDGSSYLLPLSWMLGSFQKHASYTNPQPSAGHQPDLASDSIPTDTFDDVPYCPFDPMTVYLCAILQSFKSSDSLTALVTVLHGDDNTQQHSAFVNALFSLLPKCGSSDYLNFKRAFAVCYALYAPLSSWLHPWYLFDDVASPLLGHPLTPQQVVIGTSDDHIIKSLNEYSPSLFSKFFYDPFGVQWDEFTQSHTACDLPTNQTILALFRAFCMTSFHPHQAKSPLLSGLTTPPPRDATTTGESQLLPTTNFVSSHILTPFEFWSTHGQHHFREMIDHNRFLPTVRLSETHLEFLRSWDTQSLQSSGIVCVELVEAIVDQTLTQVSSSPQESDARLTEHIQALFLLSPHYRLLWHRLRSQALLLSPFGYLQRFMNYRSDHTMGSAEDPAILDPMPSEDTSTPRTTIPLSDARSNRITPFFHQSILIDDASTTFSDSTSHTLANNWGDEANSDGSLLIRDLHMAPNRDFQTDNIYELFTQEYVEQSHIISHFLFWQTFYGELYYIVLFSSNMLLFLNATTLEPYCLDLTRYVSLPINSIELIQGDTFSPCPSCYPIVQRTVSSSYDDSLELHFYDPIYSYAHNHLSLQPSASTMHLDLSFNPLRLQLGASNGHSPSSIVLPPNLKCPSCLILQSQRNLTKSLLIKTINGCAFVLQIETRRCLPQDLLAVLVNITPNTLLKAINLLDLYSRHQGLSPMLFSDSHVLKPTFLSPVALLSMIRPPSSDSASDITSITRHRIETFHRKHHPELYPSQESSYSQAICELQPQRIHQPFAKAPTSHDPYLVSFFAKLGGVESPTIDQLIQEPFFTLWSTQFDGTYPEQPVGALKKPYYTTSSGFTSSPQHAAHAEDIETLLTTMITHPSSCSYDKLPNTNSPTSMWDSNLFSSMPARTFRSHALQQTNALGQAYLDLHIDSSPLLSLYRYHLSLPFDYPLFHEQYDQLIQDSHTFPQISLTSSTERSSGDNRIVLGDGLDGARRLDHHHVPKRQAPLQASDKSLAGHSSTGNQRTSSHPASFITLQEIFIILQLAYTMHFDNILASSMIQVTDITLDRCIDNVFLPQHTIDALYREKHEALQSKSVSTVPKLSSTSGVNESTNVVRSAAVLGYNRPSYKASPFIATPRLGTIPWLNVYTRRLSAGSKFSLALDTVPPSFSATHSTLCYPPYTYHRNIQLLSPLFHQQMVFHSLLGISPRSQTDVATVLDSLLIQLSDIDEYTTSLYFYFLSLGYDPLDSYIYYKYHRHAARSSFLVGQEDEDYHQQELQAHDENEDAFPLLLPLLPQVLMGSSVFHSSHMRDGITSSSSSSNEQKSSLLRDLTGLGDHQSRNALTRSISTLWPESGYGSTGMFQRSLFDERASTTVIVPPSTLHDYYGRDFGDNTDVFRQQHSDSLLLYDGKPVQFSQLAKLSNFHFRSSLHSWPLYNRKWRDTPTLTLSFPFTSVPFSDWCLQQKPCNHLPYAMPLKRQLEYLKLSAGGVQMPKFSTFEHQNYTLWCQWMKRERAIWNAYFQYHSLSQFSGTRQLREFSLSHSSKLQKAQSQPALHLSYALLFDAPYLFNIQLVNFHFTPSTATMSNLNQDPVVMSIPSPVISSPNADYHSSPQQQKKLVTSDIKFHASMLHTALTPYNSHRLIYSLPDSELFSIDGNMVKSPPTATYFIFDADNISRLRSPIPEGWIHGVDGHTLSFTERYCLASSPLTHHSMSSDIQADNSQWTELSLIYLHAGRNTRFNYTFHHDFPNETKMLSTPLVQTINLPHRVRSVYPVPSGSSIMPQYTIPSLCTPKSEYGSTNPSSPAYIAWSFDSVTYIGDNADTTCHRPPQQSLYPEMSTQVLNDSSFHPISRLLLRGYPSLAFYILHHWYTQNQTPEWFHPAASRLFSSTCFSILSPQTISRAPRITPLLTEYFLKTTSSILTAVTTYASLSIGSSATMDHLGVSPFRQGTVSHENQESPSPQSGLFDHHAAIGSSPMVIDNIRAFLTEIFGLPAFDRMSSPSLSSIKALCIDGIHVSSIQQSPLVSSDTIITETVFYLFKTVYQSTKQYLRTLFEAVHQLYDLYSQQGSDLPRLVLKLTHFLKILQDRPVIAKQLQTIVFLSRRSSLVTQPILFMFLSYLLSELYFEYRLVLQQNPFLLHFNSFDSDASVDLDLTVLRPLLCCMMDNSYMQCLEFTWHILREAACSDDHLQSLSSTLPKVKSQQTPHSQTPVSSPRAGHHGSTLKATSPTTEGLSNPSKQQGLFDNYTDYSVHELLSLQGFQEAHPSLSSQHGPNASAMSSSSRPILNTVSLHNYSLMIAERLSSQLDVADHPSFRNAIENIPSFLLSFYSHYLECILPSPTSVLAEYVSHQSTLHVILKQCISISCLAQAPHLLMTHAVPDQAQFVQQWVDWHDRCQTITDIVEFPSSTSHSPEPIPQDADYTKQYQQSILHTGGRCPSVALITEFCQAKHYTGYQLSLLLYIYHCCRHFLTTFDLTTFDAQQHISQPNALTTAGTGIANWFSAGCPHLSSIRLAFLRSLYFPIFTLLSKRGAAVVAPLSSILREVYEQLKSTQSIATAHSIGSLFDSIQSMPGQKLPPHIAMGLCSPFYDIHHIKSLHLMLLYNQRTPYNHVAGPNSIHIPLLPSNQESISDLSSSSPSSLSTAASWCPPEYSPVSTSACIYPQRFTFVSTAARVTSIFTTFPSDVTEDLSGDRPALPHLFIDSFISSMSLVVSSAHVSYSSFSLLNHNELSRRVHAQTCHLFSYPYHVGHRLEDTSNLPGSQQMEALHPALTSLGKVVFPHTEPGYQPLINHCVSSLRNQSWYHYSTLSSLSSIYAVAIPTFSSTTLLSENTFTFYLTPVTPPTTVTFGIHAILSHITQTVIPTFNSILELSHAHDVHDASYDLSMHSSDSSNILYSSLLIQLLFISSTLNHTCNTLISPRNITSIPSVSNDLSTQASVSQLLSLQNKCISGRFSSPHTSQDPHSKSDESIYISPAFSTWIWASTTSKHFSMALSRFISYFSHHDTTLLSIFLSTLVTAVAPASLLMEPHENGSSLSSPLSSSIHGTLHNLYVSLGNRVGVYNLFQHSQFTQIATPQTRIDLLLLGLQLVAVHTEDRYQKISDEIKHQSTSLQLDFEYHHDFDELASSTLDLPIHSDDSVRLLDSHNMLNVATLLMKWSLSNNPSTYAIEFSQEEAFKSISFVDLDQIQSHNAPTPLASNSDLSVERQLGGSFKSSNTSDYDEAFAAFYHDVSSLPTCDPNDQDTGTNEDESTARELIIPYKTMHQLFTPHPLRLQPQSYHPTDSIYSFPFSLRVTATVLIYLSYLRTTIPETSVQSCLQSIITTLQPPLVSPFSTTTLLSSPNCDFEGTSSSQQLFNNQPFFLDSLAPYHADLIHFLLQKKRSYLSPKSSHPVLLHQIQKPLPADWSCVCQGQSNGVIPPPHAQFSTLTLSPCLLHTVSSLLGGTQPMSLQQALCYEIISPYIDCSSYSLFTHLSRSEATPWLKSNLHTRLRPSNLYRYQSISPILLIELYLYAVIRYVDLIYAQTTSHDLLSTVNDPLFGCPAHAIIPSLLCEYAGCYNPKTIEHILSTTSFLPPCTLLVLPAIEGNMGECFHLLLQFTVKEFLASIQSTVSNVITQYSPYLLQTLSDMISAHNNPSTRPHPYISSLLSQLFHSSFSYILDAVVTAHQPFVSTIFAFTIRYSQFSHLSMLLYSLPFLVDELNSSVMTAWTTSPLTIEAISTSDLSSRLPLICKQYMEKVVGGHTPYVYSNEFSRYSPSFSYVFGGLATSVAKSMNALSDIQSVTMDLLFNGLRSQFLQSLDIPQVLYQYLLTVFHQSPIHSSVGYPSSFVSHLFDFCHFFVSPSSSRLSSRTGFVDLGVLLSLPAALSSILYLSGMASTSFSSRFSPIPLNMYMINHWHSQLATNAVMTGLKSTKSRAAYLPLPTLIFTSVRTGSLVHFLHLLSRIALLQFIDLAAPGSGLPNIGHSPSSLQLGMKADISILHFLPTLMKLLIPHNTGYSIDLSLFHDLQPHSWSHGLLFSCGHITTPHHYLLCIQKLAQVIDEAFHLSFDVDRLSYQMQVYFFVLTLRNYLVYALSKADGSLNTTLPSLPCLHCSSNPLSWLNPESPAFLAKSYLQIEDDATSSSL